MGSLLQRLPPKNGIPAFPENQREMSFANPNQGIFCEAASLAWHSRPCRLAMSSEAGRNMRHRQQMARKKAVVDAGIARAIERRGVVVVNTGDGSGKSAAAFGMVARALGHGLRIGVVQFIKGGFAADEESFFRRFPEVSYHATNDGGATEAEDCKQAIAAARMAWRQAATLLADATYDLVVLDEINAILRLDYLDIGQVLDALRARPNMQHVVLTGRDAPSELIDAADTVTEMREIKHDRDGGATS